MLHGVLIIKWNKTMEVLMKNIIFDIGGVLAEPKSGHWFITTNFWNILDKNLIDEEKLKMSLKKYLYLQTQKPKTEKDEHEMFSNYYYNVHFKKIFKTLSHFRKKEHRNSYL